MPYKDKKDYNAFMREYQRKQRENLKRLRSDFPEVYQLVFGKKGVKHKR